MGAGDGRNSDFGRRLGGPWADLGRLALPRIVVREHLHPHRSGPRHGAGDDDEIEHRDRERDHDAGPEPEPEKAPGAEAAPLLGKGQSVVRHRIVGIGNHQHPRAQTHQRNRRDHVEPRDQQQEQQRYGSNRDVCELYYLRSHAGDELPHQSSEPLAPFAITGRAGEVALDRVGKKPVERRGNQVGDKVERKERGNQADHEEHRQEQPLKPIEPRRQERFEGSIDLIDAEVDKHRERGEVYEKRHRYVAANSRLHNQTKAAQEVERPCDRIVAPSPIGGRRRSHNHR